MKMGSKKHKKHQKKEVPAFHEDRIEKPLKLVLKVGGSNSVHATSAPPPLPETPPHLSPQPPQLQPEQPFFHSFKQDYEESSTTKHKKSKKKKKKKSTDREKHERKHRHHHHSHHHHHHHHHHRCQPHCHQHERVREEKAEVISQAEDDTVTHEPPTKRQIVDDTSFAEQSFREPRSCRVKKKSSKTPLQLLLQYLLKIFQKRDPNQFFAWPVSDVIAPGYSSIIQHPMDFSTMKKKIDNKDYMSVMDFKMDLKLMCDNAMTYNRPDTVYYKAAKKMWHAGLKLLTKDQILGLNLPYLNELTMEEIGFDVRDLPLESQETSQLGEESNYSGPILIDNKKSKYRGSSAPEPEIPGDDMSPEEILALAQKAAKAAADRFTLECPNSKFGFLRQKSDGSTTLAILNPDGDATTGSKEMKVNLEMLTGRLSQGTGTILGFKEDVKNIVKPVSYLNYGNYSSYAPQYDSTFANLSKEESDLLYSTYGDDLGVQYAQSLRGFAQDCDYVMTMVDNLLDTLTGGQHSETIRILNEKQKIKEEDERILKASKVFNQTNNISDWTFSLESDSSGFGEHASPTDKHEDDTQRILDSSLLEFDGQRQEQSNKSNYQKIQHKLNETCGLLQDLAKVQHQRLSASPPPHLSHVSGPTAIEHEIADKVRNKLTDLTSQVSPGSLVCVDSVRKALGITATTTSSTSATPASSPAPGTSRADEELPCNHDGDFITSNSPSHMCTEEINEQPVLDPDLQNFLETGPLLHICASPTAN
ncbi:bromodomain-containing protein 7-like [Tachypleus tridentatus]|uniref:bromodomain-containing protein 7-like n=1 Tax=Tachypleus tridentatus TaxID=6853 RepID=UPI003FD601EA